MDDQLTDRLQQGFLTAAQLFAGAPQMPHMAVPAEIAADWAEFSIGIVMGEVWSRPALAPRDRALVSIALLTAAHKPDQLRSYLAIGLNQGLARSEICEAILQTAIYAGFPSAVEGFRVAAEVFEAYDQTAAGPAAGDTGTAAEGAGAAAGDTAAPAALESEE